MATIHNFADATYTFTEAHDMGNGAILPINHFAILGSKKKILIDTGTPYSAEETLEDLSAIMNPQELDYIFLTHMDLDHTGGVQKLLKAAPKARFIGNMTAMGKGTSMYNIPPERFAVVFPGQEIDLGNHILKVEPSFIEDGHTSWLLDTTTGTYFSSDAFGSLQFGQAATYAESVPNEAYAAGFVAWQSMNFNTLHMLDQKKFRDAVGRMRRLEVQQVASVHGPIIQEDLMHVFYLMEGMPTAELPPPPPLPEIFHLR